MNTTLKPLLITTLLFIFFSCQNSDSDKTQILSVMKMQENAWNDGDIDSFMSGYWQSDSLKFVGSGGITYGWQATLDNYKQKYDSKDAMGKLQFEIIQLEVNNKTAYMLGTWKLKRKNDNPGGYFTLYWKKIDGSWKIVIDHTS